MTKTLVSFVKLSSFANLCDQNSDGYTPLYTLYVIIGLGDDCLAIVNAIIYISFRLPILHARCCFLFILISHNLHEKLPPTD